MIETERRAEMVGLISICSFFMVFFGAIYQAVDGAVVLPTLLYILATGWNMYFFEVRRTKQ